jgi:FMN reductase
MAATDAVRVLAVDCSPSGAGRTSAALEAVLEAAESAGAVETRLMMLGGNDASVTAAVVEAMGVHDAFVFGSPIYRATFAAPYKALLDATPRGMWGETEAPLTAHAVAILATAASDHHFLGLGSMRQILVDFFAAHVLSPGLYLPHSSFGEDRRLNDGAAELARLQGVALVELAAAIRISQALGRVTPLA